MKTFAIILAAAVLIPGCGSDGSGGGGTTGGTPPATTAPSTLVLSADVNDDSTTDMAVVDKTQPPGQRVTSVATKDPATGQYVALPVSAVSDDLLDAVLAWDVTTPVSPTTMEASITVMDRGTPKPVIVRRVP